MSSEKLARKNKDYTALNADEEETEHLHSHGHSHGHHQHEHGEHHSEAQSHSHSHSHSHGGNNAASSYEDHDHERSSELRSHLSVDSRAVGINSVPLSAPAGRRARSPQACSGMGPGGLKTPSSEEEEMKAIKVEEEKNEKARRQLWTASLLCFCFMIAEVIGGFLANSLAIMTDAAHLLSDLAGFLISIFALWLATRAPTSRLSFGFHRAEILGALISVILIWVLTGILVYEAAFRIRNPEDVDGKLMFIVAAAGLAVNIVMGFILHQSGHGHSHGLSGGDDHHAHGHSHSHGHGHAHGSHGHGAHHEEHSTGSGDSHKNINVTAAFIHVLGDALQSVGVMVAASLIWYNPEWRIADPLTTFIFSILVLFTTARLIRQSVGVLMEGVPEGIDPEHVEEALGELPGVVSVHDLHIWSLSIGKPSLSVHLFVRDDDDSEQLLAAATDLLAAKFRIHHTTIQIEKPHDKIRCNDFEAGNGLQAVIPPYAHARQHDHDHDHDHDHEHEHEHAGHGHSH